MKSEKRISHSNLNLLERHNADFPGIILYSQLFKQDGDFLITRYLKSELDCRPKYGFIIHNLAIRCSKAVQLDWMLANL